MRHFANSDKYLVTFKQHIARFVIGDATTSQLSDIAIIGLEEGLDSPSLRILAGLNKNENPFQVEDYFSRALQELDIKLPDRRQAAIEIGIAIADRVIAGKTDLIIGIEEIIAKAIRTYDFFSESSKYCYDSIGFENVYGLYYNYDDVINAARPWFVDKTNEQVLKEVKIELLIALKVWVEKNKNGA
jgi:hypothetical protein